MMRSTQIFARREAGQRFGLVVLLSIAGLLPVRAAPTAAQPAFSAKGADTCLKCHDDPGVAAIFQTKHATIADPNSPFAKLQCETCHGPGGDHTQRLHPGQPRPPMPLFAAGSKTGVAEKNAVCMGCHEDAAHVGWVGSIHQREGLACVDCHRIHAAKDPVAAVSEQPGICYQCHRNVRTDFMKYSAHPVRDGDMDCSSCHAPHDSLYPALLIKPTLNQTCYTCHAEKRGPFLWEHPPVTEDCGNCHQPHGSVNLALLTVRPPLLCQQCHSAIGHPSVAFTGATLPGGNPSGFVLGGSCTNCHSRVHGSNAPSGADLSR
ncbi:MAG: DmsE family decaheme c-type cytochrome [Gammaproteobacteria bacterium]|nr:DmsE family decaheme c-type cytochrome [Gammaproteobacteria bacterium]